MNTDANAPEVSVFIRVDPWLDLGPGRRPGKGIRGRVFFIFFTDLQFAWHDRSPSGDGLQTAIRRVKIGASTFPARQVLVCRSKGFIRSFNAGFWRGSPR